MLCPYCNNDFKRELSRKIKCKKCGNFVFIRSVKGVKTPMTEEQKNNFDYIMSITPFGFTSIENISEIFEKEIKIAQKELFNEFGYKPSLNDSIWRALNNELIKTLSNFELGLFRNTKMFMASVLCSDEKYLQALGFMIDVDILDVCGANNISLKFQKRNEAFRQKFSFIAPAITQWIYKAKIFLKLTDNEFKNIFLTRFRQLKLSLPMLPLEEKYVFNKIINSLEDLEKNKNM